MKTAERMDSSTKGFLETAIRVKDTLSCGKGAQLSELQELLNLDEEVLLNVLNHLVALSVAVIARSGSQVFYLKRY